MNKLPQISEAEFEVMKVIWKYAPISTNEITEKLLANYSDTEIPESYMKLREYETAVFRCIKKR